MAPVLGYWDVRGLGQYLRYLLEYAKVEYKEKRYSFGTDPNWTRDEWLADKQNLDLDFPNLPYYLDGDVKLTQSLAILKYLGRKHGLAPKTDELQRRVDMIEMQAFDLIMSAGDLCYDPAYSDEKRKHFLADVAEKLRQFEALLEKDGPFAAGQNVTYVDFLLYEALEIVRVLGPSNFKRNFQSLEQYNGRVADLTGLREYLASPRFKDWPFFGPFANAMGPQHKPPSDH
ncbi:putative glutathione S-transferase [Ixodes scapularis]